LSAVESDGIDIVADAARHAVRAGAAFQEVVPAVVRQRIIAAPASSWLSPVIARVLVGEVVALTADVGAAVSVRFFDVAPRVKPPAAFTWSVPSPDFR